MFNLNCCVSVLYSALFISEVCSIERNTSHQSRIVGLFKPYSYQDRAIQLTYTDQVWFEAFKPFSANASEVWEGVCKLLSGGLLGIIVDQPLPSAVKDVIDTVHIPVVSTSIITTDTNSTIFSVAPTEEQLANALSTLIVYNSWTDVVLLTWQGSSIELFLPNSLASYKVTAVYHIDTIDTVVRSRLARIKQSDNLVIILHHYNLDDVLEIFKMAAEEGLHEYPYVWILLGSTAEMLVDRISSRNFVSYIPRLLAVYPVITRNHQDTEFIKLWENYGSVKQLQAAAYLDNAFNIILEAIKNAYSTIPNFTQIEQSCEMPLQEWQFGKTFQTILKETSRNQMLITDIVYHYFSIEQYGFNKIAKWTDESTKIDQVSSIRWCSQQEFIKLPLCQGGSILKCNKKAPPPRAPLTSAYQFDYSRYNFDVVTLARGLPFVETKTEDYRTVYEGLCIDLMDRLSEMMGFSYTIRPVEDGRYGGQDENGNWLGLIGDLVNRKAEIALAPLTITSNRGSVIDFTAPYYDVSLQALYSIEIGDSDFTVNNLFTFLRPFDTNVWLLILASVIIVSVGVTITGRLSPYDWHYSPPDHVPLWESRFQMTLFNSVWQSLTAILQQGAETAPQSTSGRILMGGWWIACILLSVTFTANLTATFAIGSEKSDIPDSVDALINKIPPEIPFGAFNNTQTTEYLQYSPIPQYREAFEYMKTEGLLYASTDEALPAVLNDNVALITDSPLVDFWVSRRSPKYNPNCTLVSIGNGQFSPGGYGLGLTKNSPFTDDFSLAILRLKEMGEIENLMAEYFSFSRTCVSEIAMTSASVTMDTQQINLRAFGGLFILLGIATIISLIALLAEHMFQHRDTIKAVAAKIFHTADHKKKDISTLLHSQEELHRTSTEL